MLRPVNDGPTLDMVAPARLGDLPANRQTLGPCGCAQRHGLGLRLVISPAEPARPASGRALLRARRFRGPGLGRRDDVIRPCFRVAHLAAEVAGPEQEPRAGDGHRPHRCANPAGQIAPPTPLDQCPQRQDAEYQRGDQRWPGGGGVATRDLPHDARQAADDARAVLAADVGGDDDHGGEHEED